MMNRADCLLRGSAADVGLQSPATSRGAFSLLRDAKPLDLPVAQLTRFDLLTNLKVAKAVGLDVPSTLRARRHGIRMKAATSDMADRDRLERSGICAMPGLNPK